VARRSVEPAMFVTHDCPKCRGVGRLSGINGAYARWLREKSGVGLREMARRLNVSAAYVSDAERGRCAFPPQWAQAYGAARAAIMGGRRRG